MIKITNTILIEEAELSESFIRSPGAGGQKVNKTETGVQLRFDARGSAGINYAMFLRLKGLAGQRMTQDGVIVITATSFRTQELNRKDARERLIGLLIKAAIPPKKRKATKPTRGSQQRRLAQKNKRSDLKKTRSKVGLE